MRNILNFVIFSSLCLSSIISAKAQTVDNENNSDKLVVLWTSGDPYVAEKVAFMYTHAAKKYGWFKEVTIIIWGPSAKLASENTMIQDKLKEMQKDGVVLEACMACSNSYGVTDKLKELGVDVKGMGTVLTAYIKGPEKVITF